MKREPIISLSVGVYECTEAGGIRNEPRPSVDLSFGPDGRLYKRTNQLASLHHLDRRVAHYDHP